VEKPGFDAIIGHGRDRKLLGVDPTATTNELALPTEWVISKGGEYFFSPSLSALQNTFAQAF
jgi:hypothetical protein